MQPVSNRRLRQLGVSFIGELNGISEFRLDANSLKILLAPDPFSRAAAVVQHVRVGSRHEGAGNTGHSHLLEHMLFKGTPTHNSAKGNSYDQFMKPLGGRYNATTNCDRTNYFAMFPAFALRDYLAHEADRLRNAILTDEDLRTEMPVVVDEFDRGENSPESVLYKAMLQHAFIEHPYRIPTIGFRSEVLKVTAALLQERLYDVYYYPNNTSLIVAGGFNIESTLQDIVTLYGDIAPSPRRIPLPYTVEPKQLGERRFVINRPGELPLVMMAFHVPEADHEDTYALAALDIILGRNESSRLYRELVNKGIASEADSWAATNHDPTLFWLSAKLASDGDPKVAERIMLAEIERVATEGVTQQELDRARVLNLNGTLVGRTNRLQLAQRISEHEAIADWRWGEQFDDNFNKVTCPDIKRVAKQYLNADNRTVGYFLPTAAQAGSASPVSAATSQSSSAPSTTEASKGEASATVPASGTPAGGADRKSGDLQVAAAGSDSWTARTRKVVLPNGMTLLLVPTSSESAIGLSLAVKVGYSSAPAGKAELAGILAEMLTEGSERYSKDRIAEMAADMQVRFQFRVQAFSTNLNVHVPPPELERFLDLLADVVQKPTLAQAELELLKTHERADLAEQDKSPGSQAYVTLVQKLYDAASPYFRISANTAAAQLGSISTGDLRDFHKANFVPKSSYLTLVGKFDADALAKIVEAKFGSWSGGDAPVIKVPAPLARSGASRFNVDIAGKANLTILVGLPVNVSRAALDYQPTVLANRALGGDTLTARLGKEIREKRGLTYGVTSQFVDTTCGGAPWMVSMTTNGGKLAQAIPLIGEVVRQFVRDGITDAELAAEKLAMTAAFDLALDTPLDVARTVCLYESDGLGLSVLDTYQANVAAITKEQVNQAIRKHFCIDQAVTVVAGQLPEGTAAS